MQFILKQLKHCLAITLFASILFYASSAFSAMDHTKLVESYEGSKTCIECHYAEAVDLTESLHYKLMGEVQGVYGMFTNKPEVGPQGKGNRY